MKKIKEKKLIKDLKETISKLYIERAFLRRRHLSDKDDVENTKKERDHLKSKFEQLDPDIKSLNNKLTSQILIRKHREAEFQSKITLIYSMYYTGSMIIDMIGKNMLLKDREIGELVSAYEISKRNPLINHSFCEDVELNSNKRDIIITNIH